MTLEVEELIEEHGADDGPLDEVKVLVVDEKWLADVLARVDGELDRVSQSLNVRVGQLAERYQESLPALDAQLLELSGRVGSRLGAMGFEWT